MRHDYHGELGCCITCTYETKLEVENWNGIEGDGCLCTSCKCRKCAAYDRREGRCDYSLEKEWEWEARRKISKAKNRPLFPIKETVRETEKAVLSTVSTADGVFGPIWIPESCLDGGRQIENWFLESEGHIAVVWDVLYEPVIACKEDGLFYRPEMSPGDWLPPLIVNLPDTSIGELENKGFDLDLFVDEWTLADRAKEMVEGKKKVVSRKLEDTGLAVHLRVLDGRFEEMENLWVPKDCILERGRKERV